MSARQSPEPDDWTPEARRAFVVAERAACGCDTPPTDRAALRALLLWQEAVERSRERGNGATGQRGRRYGQAGGHPEHNGARPT